MEQLMTLFLKIRNVELAYLNRPNFVAFKI